MRMCISEGLLVGAGLTMLDLLRLVAYTRSYKEVGPEYLKYTNFDCKTSRFAEVPLERLLKPTVVVATLTVAGKLLNQGVPRGHFDAVIVDEAGQALESETIAAPACLLGAGGSCGSSPV